MDSPPELEPHGYRSWYETPLGARVEADERALILALAELRPGERVLDLGCGDGGATGPAAEATGAAVGLDRSAAMLRAARARLQGTPGLAWVRGDVHRLPFRAACMDAVLIVTVLCTASDPPAVLAEAHRVLRPGGRLVVAELGRWSSFAALRRLRGWRGSPTWRHARFFGRRELEQLVRRAGFTEPTHASAVFYPPLELAATTGACGPIERLGRGAWPWAGALLAVRALRR